MQYLLKNRKQEREDSKVRISQEKKSILILSAKAYFPMMRHIYRKDEKQWSQDVTLGNTTFNKEISIRFISIEIN